MQKNRSLRQRESRLNCRSPFRGNGKSAYSTMIGWTCRTLADGGSFLDPVPRIRCQLHIFSLRKINGKAERGSSILLLLLFLPFPTNQKQRSGEASFWSVCSLLPSIFICRYSSDSCVIHGQSRGSILCSLPPALVALRILCREMQNLGNVFRAFFVRNLECLHPPLNCHFQTSKGRKADSPAPKLISLALGLGRGRPVPPARLNSLCITLQHYLFLSLRISLQPRCCLRG